MAIVTIKRDWIGAPSIIRIETTDSLAEVLAEGYLVSQKESIKNSNMGEFHWEITDTVLIAASDGKGMFSVDEELNLSPVAGTMITTEVTVLAADVLGMYAAPVEIIPEIVGKQIIVQSAVLSLDFNTAQYAAGGPILLQYGPAANGAGIPASVEVPAATLIGFAADSSVGFAGVSGAGTNAAKAAGIFISNKTAAFTTGDSDITLIVNYYVV